MNKIKKIRAKIPYGVGTRRGYLIFFDGIFIGRAVYDPFPGEPLKWYWESTYKSTYHEYYGAHSKLNQCIRDLISIHNLN